MERRFLFPIGSRLYDDRHNHFNRSGIGSGTLGFVWIDTLHELSLVTQLVELAVEALEADRGADLTAERVEAVHLRVGVLAGVVEDALRFSYDVATQNTPLEGSRLVIETVPLAIHCKECDDTVVLPGTQSLRCPRCSTLSNDIRQGRELELASLELSPVR